MALDYDQDLLDAALRLLGDGLDVIPLDRGSKRTTAEGWAAAPRLDAASLRASWRGGNLGLRTGRAVAGGFLHVADYDVDADTPESLAALHELIPADALGRCPTAVSGNATGNRRHFYFVTDAPLAKAVRKGPWGKIELLGFGQQAVLPPSIHPDSGRAYRWLQPPDDLAGLLGNPIAPRIEADRCRAWGARRAEDLATSADPDEAELGAILDRMTFAEDVESGKLVAALDAIAPDALDYDTFFEIGAALHRASGASDDGLALWQGCANRSWWHQSAVSGEPMRGGPNAGQRAKLGNKLATAESAARDQAKRWARYREDHPRPVALGTVYRHAQACGWEWKPATDLGPIDLGPEAPKAEATTWTFERFGETRLPDAQPYLVRGLLDQSTAACVYGRSNAGKTFVVMDLAYNLAAGQRWLGRDVRQAAVLYLALEGGTGFTRRVLGLREANGEDRDIPFFFRRGGARLHGQHAAEDVREILGMVAAVRREASAADLPVLVVIDTLSRALAGGDENSSADMGGFVRAVDAIRQKGDATVLVVHHTGKDEARGMRGHSAFLGAIDTEIEVVRPEGDGFGTVLVKKQRDHEGERTLSGFRLHPVSIGRDAEGSDVTTAVVDWGDVDLMDPPGFVDLSKPAKIAWRCFQKLLADAGDGATGVRKMSLRDAICAHHTGKNSSSGINYANRAVRALAQAGFIACADGADEWHRSNAAESIS